MQLFNRPFHLSVYIEVGRNQKSDGEDPGDRIAVADRRKSP